ncbi:hypothetical protein KCU65_g5651, partial [Aureobasidium melanogenum]
MSDLLENFSIEDLLTPTAEQSSSTISLPDLDLSNTDLNFDLSNTDFGFAFSDLPDIPDDLSLPSIDSSVSSYLGSSFDSDTGLFNNSGSSFNSFAPSNIGQFPPQQFMPMYPPEYPTAFGYQPPPGFMLVPAPNYYAQQPMMPMMQPPFQMPTQNPGFTFAPAPDAPTFPSFDLEPEPMSGVFVSTPVRRSRRTAGKKTSYDDTPCPSPAPVKRQRVSRTKKADKPEKIEKPAFELNAPMSVLTAESDLPIKNMLAVSSRSTAVRLGEAQKTGKILRPSNSFVCYRAAYADRIKQWASDDSHQVVSRIAGASWKLEPNDVRKFYIECAELDKTNHLKAFPSYKFNPKVKVVRKKTSRSARSPSPDESDDEPTPRPNKFKKLAPRPSKKDSDDDMASLFDDSPSSSPPKYNLRRPRS